MFLFKAAPQPRSIGSNRIAKVTVTIGDMEPVETHWASAFASGPAPNVRDVTIIVKEPLAHFRRDFAAANIPLYDFNPWQLRYVRPQPIQ